MLVEIFARASILIEDKQVWIVIADMEMVVHARGFCTRRLDEAMKHLSSSSRFSGLACRYAIKVHPGVMLSSQIKAAALIASRAPRCRFDDGDDSCAVLFRQFRRYGLRSRSSLAANAKALMAHLCPAELCREPMTFAGLWDEWRNKAPGEVLKSCTITEPTQARADVLEGEFPSARDGVSRVSAGARTTAAAYGCNGVPPDLYCV